MSGKPMFGRLPDDCDVVAVQRSRKPRPEPTPNQRALGLLVRREHSRKELARKLAMRGVTLEEAQATVEKMCSEGWQSDARFAELLLRSRAANGYGPVHVRAELGSHGLDHALIALTLDQFDGDWNVIARDLVHRRFGRIEPDDMLRRRKASELLMRRGFARSHAGAALSGEEND